jgi:hypothetical protein
VVRFTNGSSGKVPRKTAMIREENDDDHDDDDDNKILFSVMTVLMV